MRTANDNMIDLACFAFAVLIVLALAGCQGVQVGSKNAPAVQVGSTSRPVLEMATTQPLVAVTTPVAVNIPSMAIPAALFGGIFGSLVLVGIVLGVQRQHSLAMKRGRL
jgi:hypothetical protein